MSNETGINKTDLVDSVAKHHGLTKAQTNEIITGVFNAIAAVVREGGHVTIRGFGRFERRTHAGFNRNGKPARVTSRIFLRSSTSQKEKVTK